MKSGTLLRATLPGARRSPERSANSRHLPRHRRRRPSTRNPPRACDRSVTRRRRQERSGATQNQTIPSGLSPSTSSSRRRSPRSTPDAAKRRCRSFLALIRQRPDFITARTSAATVLVTIGRPADAVTLLRAAPEAQAGSPEILAKLGTALREAGDLRGAAVAFERSRAAGNQNPELLNDLGVVNGRLGRSEEARAQFRDLLARDPNAAGVWNNLGVLELSTGHLNAAADAFRHAVQSDPDNGDAWQGLGAATVDSDRAAAIDAWRRAERLRPHDYDLLFNLGMVLAESDHPADALPYLTRFVQEAPRAQYARDIRRVEAAIAKSRR